METSQLLQSRLKGQQIMFSSFSEAHDLVRHLGAIQAQDLASALWSIGLRLPNCTVEDVLQAFADKELIWTWTMRGTLHIVAAEDARWMLQLLAARSLAKVKSIHRQVGLTEEIFLQSHSLLQRALSGHKQLTRKEIMGLWENAGITTSNQRGYLMLARMAQEAYICLVPSSDMTQRFVLLDEWLPETKPPEHDAALAEIAKRYFVGHGPATLDDFIWWTGLTRTDSRHALALAMPDLSSVSVGAKEYFYKSTALKPSSPSVYLLPGFDEYMLGYTDRSLALRDMHRHHVYTKNAVYPGTIIIDGQVEGIWRRTPQRQELQFVISPFRKLTATEQSEIKTWVKRYGEFWGKGTTVEFL